MRYFLLSATLPEACSVSLPQLDFSSVSWQSASSAVYIRRQSVSTPFFCQISDSVCFIISRNCSVFQKYLSPLRQHLFFLSHIPVDLSLFLHFFCTFSGILKGKRERERHLFSLFILNQNTDFIGKGVQVLHFVCVLSFAFLTSIQLFIFTGTCISHTEYFWCIPN